MNGTVKVVARRAAVTAGVLGSLGLGATAIDAAAQWTAAAAPMQAPPVSPESLASQLADEQARGTDLQSRLQAAITQAAQVQAALDAAMARIATDGGTARALRAQVIAAQMKLAALDRQAAAAMRTAAAPSRTPSPSSAAPGGTAAPSRTAAPSAAPTAAATTTTNATTGASGTTATTTTNATTGASGMTSSSGGKESGERGED